MPDNNKTGYKQWISLDLIDSLLTIDKLVGADGVGLNFVIENNISTEYFPLSTDKDMYLLLSGLIGSVDAGVSLGGNESSILQFMIQMKEKSHILKEVFSIPAGFLSCLHRIDELSNWDFFIVNMMPEIVNYHALLSKTESEL